MKNELNFANIPLVGSGGFLYLKDNLDIYSKEYLVCVQKRDIQFDQKEKGETNFWLTKLAPNYDYDPETPDKIDGNIFNFNPYIGIPNETKINYLYPLIRYPKIDSDYIYIAYQMFVKSDIEETTWRWLKLRRPYHFAANVYILYRILSLFSPYILQEQRKLHKLCYISKRQPV